MICKGCKNKVPELQGIYYDCPKCRKKNAFRLEVEK